MHGADIAQLRQFGQQVDTASSELESISQKLSSQLISTVAWRGNDAAIFRDQWSSDFRPSLQQATRMLSDSAKAIERNADEQEHASADDGGSGQSGGQKDSGRDGGGQKEAGGDGGSSPPKNPKNSGMPWDDLLEPISPLRDIYGAGKTAFEIVGGIGTLGAVAKWADTVKRLNITDLEYLRNARRLQGIGGVTTVLGRAGGLLSAGTGLYEVFNPEHDGWRGVGDRVAGGLNVVSGLGSIALGFAPVAAALGPVGAGIIVGAGIVAGAWALGNAIYDNREAIAGFIKDPGPYISDGIKNIKEAGSNVVEAAKDFGNKAKDAVNEAGDWVKDKWKGLFG